MNRTNSLVAGALLLAFAGVGWWVWSKSNEPMSLDLASENVATEIGSSAGPRRTKTDIEATDASGAADDAVESGTPSSGGPMSTAEDSVIVCVVDEAGEAVSGATVWSLEWTEEVSAAIRREMEMSTAIDFESVAAYTERLGRRRVADGVGQVTVSWTGEAEAVVVAGIGERRGVGRLSPRRPMTEIVVPVGLVETYHVRVVDDERKPAAGVPLATWAKPVETFTRVRARTDDDGRARLSGPYPGRQEEAPSFVVAAGLFDPPVTATIVADTTPESPIEVTLPPTGRLRVRLISAEPLPEDVEYDVVVEMISDDTRDDRLGRLYRARQTVTIVDGEGELDRVGLGLDLTIRADLGIGFETAVRKIAGPTEPGEEVVVDLKIGKQVPVFFGRMVAEDGTPIVSRFFELDVVQTLAEEESVRASRRFKTDEAGRFHVAAASFDPPPGAAYSVRWRTARNFVGRRMPRFVGTSDLDTIEPREMNFGDVVMQRPPILVAGAVVSTTGDPIKNASIRIDVSESDRDDSDLDAMMQAGQIRSELFMQLSHVRSRADGTFVVRWKGDPKFVYSVMASVPRYSCVPVEFRVGADDVRIVVSAMGTVKGRFIQPPGLEDATLFFGLRAGETRGGTSSGIRPDGVFEESADPGVYRIIVTDRDQRVFYKTSDFVLEAGKTIDLEDVVIPDTGLRTITLTVVDERGQAIKDARVAYGESRRSTLSGGDITLTTDEPSIDVKVSAAGYRSRTIKGLDADRRVTLKRGLRVRLVVLNREALPKSPYTLNPSFDRSSHLSRHVRFDDKGEATLMVGEPGDHQLHFTLWRTSGTKSSGRGLRMPVSVEVADVAGEQRIEIRVDAEAIQEATETLR